MRTLAVVLVTLIALYGGACLALFLLQRSLIWFPQPRRHGPPEAVRSVLVPGARLTLTVRPHPGPDALLYFGGNAEDVSANLSDFSTKLPRHALYLVHYRGYGGSSGKPSERAVVADALALFDQIHQQHRRIAVVGRSMGSGVAVQLAAARPVARIVLVTPYNSVLELAAAQFPAIPVASLLKDRFESWRVAPKIVAPTLILAAEFDEVIPPDSALRLAGHFGKGVASYRVIPATGHNTISDAPQYWTALTAHLDRP